MNHKFSAQRSGWRKVMVYRRSRQISSDTPLYFEQMLKGISKAISMFFKFQAQVQRKGKLDETGMR